MTSFELDWTLFKRVGSFENSLHIACDSGISWGKFFKTTTDEHLLKVLQGTRKVERAGHGQDQPYIFFYVLEF